MGYEHGVGHRQSGRRIHGRSGRGLLFIVIGAVVVIAAVAAVVIVALGGGDGKKPQAVAAEHVLPKVYVNTPPNSLVKKLDTRGQDKRPLNRSEVFGGDAKTVKHGAYVFSLLRSSLTEDCRSVTWGQELQNDLQKYGCSQVARGAYATKDNKYVGQFVAMNLQHLKGAEQVVRDLDPDSGAGFVSPLTAEGIENFGGGFSAAYSQSFGHYVVISWVERAGGGQPQSMNELLDASIAIERADDFVWERLVLAGG